MVEALESAIKDTTTKERYFLTPAALSASAYAGENRRTSRSPRRDNQPYRRESDSWNENWGGGSWKKGSKGGSKGKKGSKGKSKEGSKKYHHTSPDGRAICFAWNNKNQRCRYECGRLHICQVCFGPHPAHACTEGSGKGSAAKDTAGANPKWRGRSLVSPQSPDRKKRKLRDTPSPQDMDNPGGVTTNHAHSKGSKPLEPIRASKAVSFTIQVLYLFAGAERKTSVVAMLREMAAKKGWEVNATEVDIKRGLENDLTSHALQDKILLQVSQGKFHVVICTPPCSTWSRVRCANMRGPPTLRTAQYVWGFPWVKEKYKLDLELGNILVRFSIQVWTVAARTRVAIDRIKIFIFGEHPEDLGAVFREEDQAKLVPASIWQLEAIRALVQAPDNDLGTVAISQCCWGTAWRKPTRLLATSPEVLSWGPNQWPTFDADGFYQGPLAKDCKCQVTQSLARSSNDTSFRTTGTDVYPEKLDKGIAAAIMEAMLVPALPPPAEGVHGDKPGKREEDESVVQEEPKVKSPLASRVGSGRPIRCYYKGRQSDSRRRRSMLTWQMAGEGKEADVSSVRQAAVRDLQENLSQVGPVEASAGGWWSQGRILGLSGR